jgi:hypothetical protein
MSFVDGLESAVAVVEGTEGREGWDILREVRVTLLATLHMDKYTYVYPYKI